MADTYQIDSPFGVLEVQMDHPPTLREAQQIVLRYRDQVQPNPTRMGPATGQEQPLPGSQSMRQTIGNAMMDAPMFLGFTPNQLTTYIKEGPVRLLTGAADALQGNYARGGHDVLSGAGMTALPFGVSAAVEAPIVTALTLAAGAGGQAAMKKGAELMGATPDQANLAGDVGGIVTGGAVAGSALAFRKLAGQLRDFLSTAKTVVKQNPGLAVDAVGVGSPRLRNGIKLAQAVRDAMPATAPATPPAAAPAPASTPGGQLSAQGTAAQAPPAAASQPPGVHGQAVRKAAAAPSGTAAAGTGAGLPTLEELNLTPAEIAQGIKWQDKNVPAEEILRRILESRDLTAKIGATTPQDAATAIQRRNETGKWPD